MMSVVAARKANQKSARKLARITMNSPTKPDVPGRPAFAIAKNHQFHGVARARAGRYQQGLPLVRAANTGISGFIDPTGRIQAPTDLFVNAVAQHEVAALATQSLYTRIGDVFAWLCLAAAALMVGAQIACSRRTRS